MQSEKKIIVVEDDATTQAILCGSLNAAGYQALEAESGLPVMQMIRQHAPVLIITDLVMEKQEGMETILQVRDLYESLPIIAISAHLEYLPIAEAMGADAVFLKPISVPRILAKVSELVRR